MSHFLLRVGGLFHLCVVAPSVSRRRAHPISDGPAGVSESPESSGRDDLAFLSLSIEARTPDSRAELGRLGLLPGDAPTRDRENDFLRDQWLAMP